MTEEGLKQYKRDITSEILRNSKSDINLLFNTKKFNGISIKWKGTYTPNNEQIEAYFAITFDNKPDIQYRLEININILVLIPNFCQQLDNEAKISPKDFRNNIDHVQDLKRARIRFLRVIFNGISKYLQYSNASTKELTKLKINTGWPNAQKVEYNWED